MENGPKPSCKSQYLAIHGETQTLLKQGYTIKAVYDYFLKKGVIHMSYNSWTKIFDQRQL
jgi:hypothetical protein